MASAQLLAPVVLAVAVLTAGGVYWLWHRRKVRRHQREESWRELCLRLELALRSGDTRVGAGELPETHFVLHDTGSDWLVELPLAQPLLPPGMLLLSPDAPTLPPHLGMRPLEWDSASAPPGLRAWSVEGEGASGKVEAPPAFLEEAARAMQAHAPLRVEPLRLIQALRVGDLLSVKEAREAVRALDTTARGWLEVAERHGLPRVQSLPEPEPTRALPVAQEVQAPPPALRVPSSESERVRHDDSSPEIVVDFNSLPRATRERIVAGTRPGREALPILAERSFRGGFLWTVAVAGVGAFCLWLLYQLMRGGRGGPWWDQPELGILQITPTLFFCFAAGLILLFQGRWRKTLPFHPGRYVFPFDFVDATTRQLRIIPLRELADIQRKDHYESSYRSPQPHYSYTTLTLRFGFNDPTMLRFPDSRRIEKFEIHGQELADAQVQALRRAHAAFRSKAAARNEKNAHENDLFFELRRQPGGLEAFRDKGPAEDSGGGPLAQELPGRLRPSVLLFQAFMVSLVLGPSLWLARNYLGDEAAFEAAKKDSSGRELKRYADSQGRHAAEALQLGMQLSFQSCERTDTEECWKQFILLWPFSPRNEEVLRVRRPRAALKATPRTVATLKDFLNRYPASAEAVEVRERLLPEAAFRELPAGSVIALRRYRQWYPRSAVDARIQERLQVLFAAARTELLNQASPQNPQAVLFMSKLLTHMETSDSSVVPVGFRRQVAPSLQRADSLLGQAAQGQRDNHVAPVSAHFDAWSTERFEGHTVKALGNAFGQLFSGGMVTLVHGESLPEQTKDSDVTRPRIDIGYTVSWPGGLYKHGGRQFAGLQFDFDVSLRVPGAQPVRFSLQVKPPKAFPFHGSEPAPSHSAVYNALAQRAFDALSEKLGTAFFRADSKAFQALKQKAP